jgi:hypothetical protein
MDATTRGQIPSHPGDIDLSFEQVCDRLSALEGQGVHVRVVERSDPEILVATFEGPLGAQSGEKHPALFWPVGGPQRSEHHEEPGFYLRAERFEGAVGRAGLTVLVVTQGPVLINLRA